MGQIQRCKNHLVFRVVLCIQELKNSSCVNVSQSTSAKLESRSVTPVGSYTALNMASSPMVICHQTKLLEMTPSKPSSQRLEVANTFPGLSLLTWNQLRLMKLDVELIASCIIPSNSLMARKMLQITMLVVTTPLERRLSILFLIVSESWLTLALVFKDSFSSTLSVEVPDLDLHLFSWSVCLSTTARNQNLNSPSTQLLKLPPLLLSLTMLS